MSNQDVMKTIKTLSEVVHIQADADVTIVVSVLTPDGKVLEHIVTSTHGVTLDTLGLSDNIYLATPAANLKRMAEELDAATRAAADAKRELDKTQAAYDAAYRAANKDFINSR